MRLSENPILEKKIEDRIASWHKAEKDYAKCSLAEALGMTWEEYSTFATTCEVPDNYRLPE